jgi:hypothetical protein
MKYTKWDELVLKINDHFGYKDKVVLSLKVMIIGIDNDTRSLWTQYLCYVPSYVSLPFGFSVFKINAYHAQHFDIDNKFIGDRGCFIDDETPIFSRIATIKGAKCSRCKEFFAGIEDIEGYACRACRENPWR